MEIDHITIAGPDLAVLQEAFATAGLTSQYGGRHSNGITHMSWLGFDDYSYLELVSTPQTGTGVPLWKGHTCNPAGGTAWTIYADGIATEAERIRAQGVTVHGPIRIERQKPDGRVGKWDLGYLGDASPGGVLPFLIEDETPRSVRVTPSPSVADSTRVCPGKLGGLKAVVIAVRNLDDHVASFREVWGWNAPRMLSDRGAGVQYAFFEGQPVVLASPAGDAVELNSHLGRYGESPFSCLISSGNFVENARHFRSEPEDLGHFRVAWIDLPGVTMLRVGLMDSL